jgi:hypothetical protein
MYFLLDFGARWNAGYDGYARKVHTAGAPHSLYESTSTAFAAARFVNPATRCGFRGVTLFRPLHRFSQAMH